VPRIRIDQLLVERGFAENRHKAQALILAGHVLAAGQRVDKPGARVDPECEIRLLGQVPFVSRAGAKLQAALEYFEIAVQDRVCADLGASTGGFTDCLLQRGARSVRAFDVGRGQIAWKLRSDPRVEVRDGFNVRYVTANDLPAEISLVTLDLSFISLQKVLAPLAAALGEKRVAPVDVVALVKPQFEVGKGEVGKGGIVRDSEARARAVAAVSEFAAASGYTVMGSMRSPITGASGNQEFLLYLLFPAGLTSSK
jgi:23S rRNA (cytidine1920-2'-O)/16S rRNA (cytidine1409-2'-O)-methyltransferase